MRCDCCPACCAAHAQGQCPQDAPVYNAPIALYSGITLTFLHYIDMDRATLPALPADALALHFCLTGRAGFALPEGGTRYLGDGEALLCLSGERTLTLPNACYDGLLLCLSGDALPEPLARTPVTLDALKQKFFADEPLCLLPESEALRTLLCSFFDLPAALLPAAYQLKAQEALLRLYQQPAPQRAALPQYPAAQTEVIRRVHDQLTQNLQQRVTIEELSHQFLMNPSTLKAVFKDVYGDSIAAHIREHRMERAAELLRGTELGMGQIAQQIGYESASKFSAEFRKHFGLLPSEYRKMHK